jgi:hypothetical protein
MKRKLGSRARRGDPDKLYSPLSVTVVCAPPISDGEAIVTVTPGRGAPASSTAAPMSRPVVVCAHAVAAAARRIAEATTVRIRKIDSPVRTEPENRR